MIVILKAAIGMPLVNFMGLEVPNVFHNQMMKLWKCKERAYMYLDTSKSILVETTNALLLVATEDRMMQILSAAKT